ncbi:MAG: acetylxylan esterase [Acidobacteria bacterium]|nr:acetylxylan esterase [Acidobacteriota bacterium]
MRLGFVLAILMAAPAAAQMLDDHLTGIARKHWEARAREVAALTTREGIAARQQWARTKFTDLLGGFPEKTPLNARITGTLERDGYRVEKLVFESLPGFYVTANVYVPARLGRPFPAVIGTAGHSDAGKAQWNYQRAWIGMAKRGFLVLALDPPGQGERLEAFDPELGTSRIGIGTPEHTTVGVQCLLTGGNLARYVIWDGIRSVDYLLTRNDVDPGRLAVAGNSGGGMQAAYLALAEPRLAVAAPSCYMTSSEKLWTDLGPQDAEQNVAGFLSAGLGLADFALAFAPRPFLMLTATRDFFPIAGARATYAEVRAIYQTAGRAEAAGFFEFDDTHGWSLPRREATYRWLERWFHHREDNGAEGDFREEPESALNVTPTGQVATSFGGETVRSLNAALAEQLARSRKPVTAETVRKRLAIDPARLPAAQVVGRTSRPGFRVEEILLTTEPGISIPVLVLVPEPGGGRRPAVLYLHSAGKAKDAVDQPDPAALVGEGRVVIAPDLRGWGTTKGGSGLHGGAYQTGMRAILLGRSMAGMQVTDLLSVFAYAASRDDVDAANISILAKEQAGPLALMAALLEPRIARVACQDAILSYLDYVRAKYPVVMPNLIVPGILRDFDLPEIAAALAPRPVWLVAPVLPSEAKAPLAVAKLAYRSAANVRVRERPGGWPFPVVYRDWLGR